MAAVVTLTLNPAIDTSTSVARVAPEKKLRCEAPIHEPGGGGLNVARAIRNLGGDVCAWWASGGRQGRRLGDLLDADGLSHRPFPIAGETRENLAVFEEASAQQYRFNMPGGEVADAEEVLAAIRASDPAYLVLSGSLPPGLDPDFYARAAAVAPPGTRVVVDTSGEPLRHALAGGAFLAKPNLGELREVVGEDLGDDDRIAAAIREVVRGGVEVMVVSIGAGGVLLGTAEGVEAIRAPTVPIRSKVGAGDSTVGGIVAGLCRGMGVRDAVRFGVAAGAAAVMTEGTRLCRREDVERLWEAM